MGGQPSPIEPEQEPAPEFAVPNFIQERFCISDDTCVDYSGTDYICVAGKCVPMGGQPSPIEPEVKQLDKPGGETRDTYNTPAYGNDGATSDRPPPTSEQQGDTADALTSTPDALARSPDRRNLRGTQ
jgi:hypothetical protein